MFQRELKIRAHPNVEPHTVRLVGDTDHRTKLETGTASTEPKRVRSLETFGGGKRTEDCGSWPKTPKLQAVLQPGMGDSPAIGAASSSGLDLKLIPAETRCTNDAPSQNLVSRIVSDVDSKS